MLRCESDRDRRKGGLPFRSRFVSVLLFFFFFFSSRRRHTRSDRDWSSDVCSSDLGGHREVQILPGLAGHVLALAVLAALGLPVRAVAVVEQGGEVRIGAHVHRPSGDRKSTRLNSSHDQISYAVFCLKKKKKKKRRLANERTKTQTRKHTKQAPRPGLVAAASGGIRPHAGEKVYSLDRSEIDSNGAV